MNYPESLWASFRSAKHPIIAGEQERRLKAAFLHGMHAGQELVVQSTHLPDKEMIDFNQALQEQVTGALSKVGERPGTIKVSNIGPVFRGSINGEPV